MGLLRKTMSLSTMGVVNYRDRSERAAAAERSKTKAYRERTKMLREESRADRQADLLTSKAPEDPAIVAIRRQQEAKRRAEDVERLAQAAADRAAAKARKAEAKAAAKAAAREAEKAPKLPPAGWYDDPDGGEAKRWWDGSRWTEHRNS